MWQVLLGGGRAERGSREAVSDESAVDLLLSGAALRLPEELPDRAAVHWQGHRPHAHAGRALHGQGQDLQARGQSPGGCEVDRWGAEFGHGRPLHKLQVLQVHAARQYDKGGGRDRGQIYQSKIWNYGARYLGTLTFALILYLSGMVQNILNIT